MAFPNSSITDIIATTLEGRSRKIADNVTANNAGLTRIKSKGGIKTLLRRTVHHAGTFLRRE